MPQFPQMDDALPKLFHGAYSLPPLPEQVWVKSGTGAGCRSRRTSPPGAPSLPGQGNPGTRVYVPLQPLSLVGRTQGTTLEPCSAQSGQQLEKFRNVEGTSWRGLVVPLQCGLGEGAGCFGSLYSGVLSGGREGWLRGNSGWLVHCSALCPGVPSGLGVD